MVAGQTLGALYTVSESTGAGTYIALTNDAAGRNYSLTGMAYDWPTGTLYGVTGQSATDSNWLVKVDPLTAAIVPIGPLGTRLTDVTYSPKTGEIIGVSGSSKFAYRLNLTTGLATIIGPTGLTPQDGGALTYLSSGKILNLTLSNQATGAETAYSLDYRTGADTVIGPTDSPYFNRGAATTPDDRVYVVTGGTLGLAGRTRFLNTCDPATGHLTLLGKTVDSLDALVFLSGP